MDTNLNYVHLIKLERNQLLNKCLDFPCALFHELSAKEESLNTSLPSSLLLKQRKITVDDGNDVIGEEDEVISPTTLGRMFYPINDDDDDGDGDDNNGNDDGKKEEGEEESGWKRLPKKDQKKNQWKTTSSPQTKMKNLE